MKKRYKITFTVDATYPYATKHIKKMEKDFDNWLREYAKNAKVVPLLFEPNKNGAIENQANATVRVKIVRDKEVILNTWWDELSDDF